MVVKGLVHFRSLRFFKLPTIALVLWCVVLNSHCRSPYSKFSFELKDKLRQDVEEAAVEGATQAAKEMELGADREHNPDRAYAERAIAQRVENAAVKSAILAADAVADAHTPHAHKAVLVRPLARAQPVAVVRPAMGGGGGAYAVGPGVAAGGAGTGAQFVPDAAQSVPGMVTGTVYMPPSP